MTVFFRRENGTNFPTTLSYSIQPSGLLIIERGRDHAVCCFGGIDQHLVDSRWQTHLPSDRQMTVRKMLARLRPRALSRDYPFALPTGCSYISDSRSWAGVDYAQGKVGGVFIFQPGCTGDGAESARHLLREVVAALPSVAGATEFVEQTPR